jgi:outer membrane protein assembly factor BamB
MTARLCTLFSFLILLASCQKSPTDKEQQGEEGIIYTINNEGAITAFDLATESILWTGSASYTQEGLMVYDDGTLYVTNVMGITAVDAATGTLKWSKQSYGGFNGNGYKPECRPVIKDSLVYVVMAGSDGQNPTLYCINKNTGAFRWDKEIVPHASYSLLYTTPVVVGDKVIALGRGSQTPINDIYCFNRLTGAPVWHNDTIQTVLWSFPFSPDPSQVIFLGSYGGYGVNSLDVNNGHVLWQSGAFPVSGALITPYQNNKMILLSYTGEQTGSFNLTTHAIENVTTDANTWRATIYDDKIYYQKYGYSLECRAVNSTVDLWKRDTPTKHIWDSLAAYPAWQYLMSYSSALTSDGETVYFYENIREGAPIMLNSLYLLNASDGSLRKEIKLPTNKPLLGKHLIVVKKDKVYFPAVKWGF